MPARPLPVQNIPNVFQTPDFVSKPQEFTGFTSAPVAAGVEAGQVFGKAIEAEEKKETERDKAKEFELLLDQGAVGLKGSIESLENAAAADPRLTDLVEPMREKAARYESLIQSTDDSKQARTLLEQFYKDYNNQWMKAIGEKTLEEETARTKALAKATKEGKALTPKEQEAKQQRALELKRAGLKPDKPRIGDINRAQKKKDAQNAITGQFDVLEGLLAEQKEFKATGEKEIIGEEVVKPLKKFKGIPIPFTGEKKDIEVPTEKTRKTASQMNKEINKTLKELNANRSLLGQKPIRRKDLIGEIQKFKGQPLLGPQPAGGITAPTTGRTTVIFGSGNEASQAKESIKQLKNAIKTETDPNIIKQAEAEIKRLQAKIGG